MTNLQLTVSEESEPVEQIPVLTEGERSVEPERISPDPHYNRNRHVGFWTGEHEWIVLELTGNMHIENRPMSDPTVYFERRSQIVAQGDRGDAWSTHEFEERGVEFGWNFRKIATIEHKEYLLNSKQDEGSWTPRTPERPL